MPDFFGNTTFPDKTRSASSAPSLKTRLRLSIVIIVLPLFILGGIGFLFFQKSTNAFNLAIEEVVSDIIPVTELKDKIQKTVAPFNRYLETGSSDEKQRFLQLSNEIKQTLNHPVKTDKTKLTLANDIYHTAYLHWRNAHRIAVKIFNHNEQSLERVKNLQQVKSHQRDSILQAEHKPPYRLLQKFYQYVIETTLALDKLHLSMQNQVKIRFQKAKELKLNALLMISFVFLLVYISTLATIMLLNRSILEPVIKLEQWASKFSRDKSFTPLKLDSYREFEFIAQTYNRLFQMLQDDKDILANLSQKDELTQLNNKRSLITRLTDEHSRHQRYNTRYSLMLIDVDHLGSISQNYGEHICDLTLIQIARLLEHAIRPTDFLARYNSDEFIIILPEVELHGANITAERIRNAISEHVFKFDDYKFGITVSIGFAIIQENQPLEEVLQCVDFAIQQAKLAGRNQVQFCNSETVNNHSFSFKYLLPSDFEFPKE